MNNLDLHELRCKLNSAHESQGVSKSVAMKLMQELEEARARHRKAWGRAEKAEAAVARVREGLPPFNRALEYSVPAEDIYRALDGEQG